MKNYFCYLLKSKLNLNIKGKNIRRFIKRLKNKNIDILNIIILNDDEMNIKIYKKDYETILNIKTIYEINILNYSGTVKIKNNILDNKYIIITILICLVLIYIVSNLIFKIEVITNDTDMANSIIFELNKNGIKKYHFKKNYEELQIIKANIKNKFKDQIEWIEIENIGTKYIIKYEPRLINKDKKSNTYRNIISKKDALIVDMNISKGQIVKSTNSYVKKGDIVVSGIIKFDDSIKDIVSSEGSIYGETWYIVNINYPFHYYENKETGNKKNVYIIKFFSKELELLNFNKYKYKNTNDKLILKNNIIPIYLIKQTQYETNIVDKMYTKENILEEAIKYSKEKIQKNLNKDEYIKNYKILNKKYNSDSVSLDIFFCIIENITDYEEIILEEKDLN